MNRALVLRNLKGCVVSPRNWSGQTGYETPVQGSVLRGFTVKRTVGKRGLHHKTDSIPERLRVILGDGVDDRTDSGIRRRTCLGYNGEL